jgi:hypothetical protein
VFCAKAFEAKLTREKKWFFVGECARGRAGILRKMGVYPLVFFFAKKCKKSAFFVKKGGFFAIFWSIFDQKSSIFDDFFKKCVFIGGLC